MVLVEKITKEEVEMMNDQLNEEIEWDIASQEYMRDNTSDVQLIAFYNDKIEDLKSRRV